MKSLLFISLSLIALSTGAQSLRDSLYGGKMKADSGKTIVSTDTGRYKADKIVLLSGPDSKPGDAVKPVESMPDSLNSTYYAKQRLWKRFIDGQTNIITQEANDNRKVKKGEYTVEIDYEIGLNGKIATNSITVTPQNDFLQERFTEMMKRPPTLAAPVYSDGKPRVLPAVQTVKIVKK